MSSGIFYILYISILFMFLFHTNALVNMHYRGLHSIVKPKNYLISRPLYYNRYFSKKVFREKNLKSNPYKISDKLNKNDLVTYSNKIKLTDEERELFQFLSDVGKWRGKNGSQYPVTVVRVAGGWVRDRLLSLGNKKDVDIALDNLTGIQFTNKMNAWNRANHKKILSVGYIHSNPTKSKHLETATTRIGNFSCDFVNLRTEHYAKTNVTKKKKSMKSKMDSTLSSANTNTRIPVEVGFGSPLEDALRRDLTINSLFYNINTDTVEDYLNHGMSDLTQKLIRTPLEPLITFQDDPLRVLRLIRFACRLDFNIDPYILSILNNTNIVNNIQDSDDAYNIIQLINSKISRERISDELDKMLFVPPSVANACDLKTMQTYNKYASERAISLLQQFNILNHTIFIIPDLLYYVPNPETCIRMVNVGTKGSNAQEHNMVELNRNNCDEFDSFREYGVCLSYLLRVVEQNIVNNASHPMNSWFRLQETSPFLSDTVKYLRYAGLTWWGHDKYVQYNIQPAQYNMRNVPLIDYIFKNSLKLSNKDHDKIVIIQHTALRFMQIFNKIQQYEAMHGKCDDLIKHDIITRADLGLLIKGSKYIDKDSYVDNTNKYDVALTNCYLSALLLACSELLLNDIILENQHLMKCSNNLNDDSSADTVVDKIQTIQPFPYTDLLRKMTCDSNSNTNTAPVAECDMSTKSQQWCIDIHSNKTNIKLSSDYDARTMRYLSLILDALQQYQYIHNEKSSIFDIKPCINGNEIKNIFGKTKDSFEIIGHMMQKQLIYQLNHPMHNKNDCKEYLMKEFVDYL